MRAKPIRWPLGMYGCPQAMRSDAVTAEDEMKAAEAEQMRQAYGEAGGNADRSILNSSDLKGEREEHDDGE